MSKRGSSDFIFTVLVVLIVIVSVLLVWVFISGFLDSGSEVSFDLSNSNLSVDQESVIVNGSDVEFVVKRESGDGVEIIPNPL